MRRLLPISTRVPTKNLLTGLLGLSVVKLSNSNLQRRAFTGDRRHLVMHSLRGTEGAGSLIPFTANVSSKKLSCAQFCKGDVCKIIFPSTMR